MGLFGIFKKDKVKSIEMGNHYDNELLEIVRIVSFNNELALKDARDCIENPMKYYSKHIDCDDSDSFDQDEISFVQWMECVDILMRYGYVCECDWKEGKDEFLYQISALKGISLRELKIKDKWFDEKLDIPTWCDELDKKWKKLNCVVAAFDTESDSYVMFICKIEELEVLMDFAKKIGQRIDFAKDM